MEEDELEEDSPVLKDGVTLRLGVGAAGIPPHDVTRERRSAPPRIERTPVLMASVGWLLETAPPLGVLARAAAALPPVHAAV